MYISLYDDNLKHVANISGVTYELTQRVYDLDSFSAEGICSDDVNDATLLVLNSDSGDYVYSCFVDNIVDEFDKKTVKGLDFKTLWDNEIIIDYTQPKSFDGKISPIFNKIKDLLFNDEDILANKIPVEVNIPRDDTNTESVYGTYQGTYTISSAYQFLKCYLKYYEYNIESRFDVANAKIVFDFVRADEKIDVGLKDFVYELTTSSVATNKAIALLKWEEKEKNDDGTESETLKPRPDDILCKYYYIDKKNNIVQSNAVGNIADRIYPIKTKIFEDTDISKAVYNAIDELANSRYVDNIIIDNNKTLDPIDLANYRLYLKVSLYYNGKLYKTLPITEKTTTCDEKGTNTKIKLGFKKILLTEILKEKT